jgi:hypothetical protein
MDEFLPGVMIAAATAKPDEAPSPPMDTLAKKGGQRGKPAPAIPPPSQTPPTSQRRQPGLPLPPGIKEGGQNIGITRKILRCDLSFPYPA